VGTVRNVAGVLRIRDHARTEATHRFYRARIEF
jgi:hypothetical protein